MYDIDLHIIGLTMATNVDVEGSISTGWVYFDTTVTVAISYLDECVVLIGDDAVSSMCSDWVRTYSSSVRIRLGYIFVDTGIVVDLSWLETTYSSVTFSNVIIRDVDVFESHITGISHFDPKVGSPTKSCLS